MASAAMVNFRARMAKNRQLLSMGSIKPVAISGAVGAAAQFAGGLAAQNLAFVRNNWYGEGAVLGAAAVLMARRPAISHALAGAAGYSMAMRKRAQSSASGSTGTTAGEDTGYLQSDTGYIQRGRFDYGT